MADENIAAQAGEDFLDLVVDGRAERLTKKQVIEDAQRARGVLPKMQSERDDLKRRVTEMEEESKAADAFIGDFRAILEGGDKGRAAFSRMSAALGLDSKSMIQKIASASGVPQEAVRQGLSSASSRGRAATESDDELLDDRDEPASPRRRITLDDLDEDLAREVKAARSRRLGDLRGSLHSELEATFASTPELVKLMANPKVAKVVKDLGQKALKRRVNVEGEEVGPRLYRAIADEVRLTLDDLGIHPSDNKKPVYDAELASAFGLNVGNGAMSGDELHRDTPPERVPLSSGEYRRSFGMRLLHRLSRAVRGEEAGEPRTE